MSVLLTLTQWMSPAFPLGAFAYSHGLEAAIDAGGVSDGSSLSLWLSTVLEKGSGRSDAIILVHAMKPDADHEALTDTARALCASRERAIETDAQGEAFTRTVNALTGSDDAPAPLPVAVGRAAARLEAEPTDVAALYLQAFAGNLVTIGVRHIPLGQTEGQRVLADLHPLIESVAQSAQDADLEAITNGAFAADVSALSHETQTVRIFKT